MEIPTGTYDLVRLYVDEAGLKLKDSEEIHRVKVPSGSQTGIKIFLARLLKCQRVTWKRCFSTSISPGHS
jgi:hypothetical protein